MCQNNFPQVLHRSKEKGEKQAILVNGIREVGRTKTPKTQKYDFLSNDCFFRPNKRKVCIQIQRIHCHKLAIGLRGLSCIFGRSEICLFLLLASLLV